MLLDYKQKKDIRAAFKKMKNRTDLLSLLNHAKRLLYGDDFIPFSIKQLNYYSNPSHATRYIAFTLEKRSGGSRTIHAPVKTLKILQKCMNLVLQAVYDVHPYATGFIPGKSVTDNAAMHTAQRFVFCIDLKDFFHSIDQARIWGRLQHPPFNLSDGRRPLANVIAGLCCHELEVERLDENGTSKILKKNVLPQGAPTSPTFTNIICQQLDFYLTAVAKRFGLNYSRYADDITFSSAHHVYKEGGEFITEVRRIVGRQNFVIKESKTRLRENSYRQEVTGLTVNVHPNVSKDYIKSLRMWLYYSEQYGYEYAASIFCDSNGSNNLRTVLRGKLNYLKMIKGEKNSVYTKLADRFEKFVAKPVANRNVGKMSFPSPTLHKPLSLVELLAKFTVNNTALKHATHNWESGKDIARYKDFDEFRSQLKSEWDQISGRLKELNHKLAAKINAFLLQENVAVKGWGDYRVKFGWSSPELATALLGQPNLQPEEFLLPDYAQFQIKKAQSVESIRKFRQVIDLFKNEIEFRDENDSFFEMILSMHDKYLHGFTIGEIGSLHNRSFFTDVPYLRRALVPVFENIQKRPHFPEVSYLIVDLGNRFEFQIIHKDSTLRGVSLGSDKLKADRGDFGTVKELLTNLCDWSVESEFSEGAYRLNYLVSDVKVPPFEKIQNAKGFKYCFKFYKP